MVTTCPADGADVKLRAVFQYTHLGGQFATGNRLEPELAYRASAAFVALASLRRGVLKRSDVSLQAKILSVNSLVFSRMLYGAGTWPPCRSLAILLRPWRSAARAVTSIPFNREISDCDLARLSGLLPLHAELRKRRLAYVGRVLAHSVTAHRALVGAPADQPRSWTILVLHDFGLLRDAGLFFRGPSLATRATRGVGATHPRGPWQVAPYIAIYCFAAVAVWRFPALCGHIALVPPVPAARASP